MNSDFTALLATTYHDGLIATAILVAVVIVALVLQRLFFGFVLRLSRKNHDGVFAALVRRAEAPAGFAIPLLAVLIVVPELKLPPWILSTLERATAIATVVAVAWTIIASIELYTDLVKRRYRIDVEDNLRARQVETRINILSRACIAITIVVGSALALMTFPSIRAFGTTLLASAGVVGLVVGLAARPFFENLVAGVQIALTQPIRLDDVVIVEGEYGHVESIGATYVVVNLWDRRKMVLPLTYFIEKPFQNWTRTGAALIGSVMIYVDYSVPVAEVRAQIPKILGGAKLWDGAVQNLQVTDCTANVLELRILVSARNSPDLFDLRCEVREKIVAWLAQTYPDALPVRRFVERSPEGAAVAIR